MGKTSRTQYVEKGKMRISRYSSLYRYRESVRHFANEFPQLNESSIQRWTSRYKSQLFQEQTERKIIIGLKRGRPTLLSSELDVEDHDTKHENIRCTHEYSHCAWRASRLGRLMSKSMDSNLIFK